MFPWYPKFTYIKDSALNNYSPRDKAIEFLKIRILIKIYEDSLLIKNDDIYVRIIKCDYLDSEEWLKSEGFTIIPAIENDLEDKNTFYVKVPYY